MDAGSVKTQFFQFTDFRFAEFYSGARKWEGLPIIN